MPIRESERTIRADQAAPNVSLEKCPDDRNREHHEIGRVGMGQEEIVKDFPATGRVAHPKRDEGADFIKGILITLMVYGHLDHLGYYHGTQIELVTWIYTFHMPIFFLISGFFFCHVLRRSSDVPKVIRTLFVPYAIFEMLYLVALAAIQFVGIRTSNQPPSSANDYVLSIIAHPVGAYWFLYTIAVIQIVSMASKWLAEKFGILRDTGWMLGVLILVVLCASGVLREWAVAYFLLGTILASGGYRFWASPIIGLVGIAVSVFSLKATLFSFSVGQVVWCLSISAALSGFSKVVPRLFRRVVVWLGRNSLLILVFHASFVIAMKPLAPALLKIDGTGIALAVLTTTIGTVGSVISGIFFDRIGLAPLFFGKAQVYIPIEG